MSEVILASSGIIPYCSLKNKQYNDNFVCVIPTNIYGPYDNFNLNDAHVIPALIHKCYIAKQNNTKFVISGTGTPLRQFIFSEDLANTIMWAIEEYKEKESTLVIYTPAIPKNLGELNFLMQHNFQLFKRSQVLGIITANSLGLGVAGTHGKTTTSTLLAHILNESSLKCNAFLG